MVTPLSGNPIPPLSTALATPISGNAGNAGSAVSPAYGNPDNPLLGNSGNPLLEAPASAVLAAELTVNAEDAVILELAVQAAEPAVLSQSMATAAAATVDISPEALAQAAAFGLPATLTDGSPEVPRSFARPARSEGSANPISALDRWQDAIRFFKERDPRPSLPPSKPRALPICPFCGLAHPLQAAGLTDKEICPVQKDASAWQP
jgi:hypothetical protein